MSFNKGGMPEKRLTIGILGAAAIARKNVKAIGKTTNGVGRFLNANWLQNAALTTAVLFAMYDAACPGICRKRDMSSICIACYCFISFRLRKITKLQVVLSKALRLTISIPRTFFSNLALHRGMTSTAEIVAIGSRTMSKAEAFIDEMGLTGQAKAYGRLVLDCNARLPHWWHWTRLVKFSAEI